MVRAPFSSLCFSVFGAVALAVALPSGALPGDGGVAKSPPWPAAPASTCG